MDDFVMSELSSMPALGSISATEIKEGDTIILRWSCPLSDERLAKIEERFVTEFSEKVGVAVSVIVLDPSVTIDAIVRAA